MTGKRKGTAPRKRPSEVRVEDVLKGPHRPTDGQTSEVMQAIMRTITKIFPLAHVTLLIAPFEPSTGQVDPDVNYISTANRDEMIAVMKSFVARQDIIPANLKQINDAPPTETPQ